MQWNIPRIVIAATQSGGGKTTLVTGLLSALRARGLRVQSFKVGPDYIDLGYHQLASGRTGHNLDTWLVPEARLTEIFARECADADIAVIEGVMGLYDGGRRGVSSTAAIAKALDAPVLLVIDAKSVGASAAATALGFRVYDTAVNLAGVLLNRLGSETHEEMVRTAMEGVDLRVYGALRRDAALALPERHLGLTPVEEHAAATTIAAVGERVETGLDLDAILELARSASPLSVAPPVRTDAVSSVRIGVARDEAFSLFTTRRALLSSKRAVQRLSRSARCTMKPCPMLMGSSSAAVSPRCLRGSWRRIRRCVPRSALRQRRGCPSMPNAVAICI